MSKPDLVTETSEFNDIEPMLSLRDIARRVGLSLRTVAAWRAEGYLCRPDLVHGKTVRWKRETVETWLAQQSVNAQ